MSKIYNKLNIFLIISKDTLLNLTLFAAKLSRPDHAGATLCKRVLFFSRR